ncbi:MAG: hypothetical protein GWP59_07870 [Chlamydiales bacterium]|nr:DNA-binding domain-containing protein [Chlamydiales bacterium]NCF71602.1 hypothetical protein [Chlamydiales bacterium]
MFLKDGTQKAQREMANFCRKKSKLSDDLLISNERAKVYRRLICNNIDSTLQNAYPITYHLLSDDQWKQVVDDFLASDACISPYLWEMPKALVSFAKSRGYDEIFALPFLNDLLLFEWLEIEVYMMPNKPAAKELEEKAYYQFPIVNPEHKLLQLEYPVFKKTKCGELSDKKQYFISLHRHPETKQVLFFEHSSFFIYLLEEMSESKICMDHMVEKTVKDFGWKLNQTIHKKIKLWLENITNEKLLLGWAFN